MIQRRKRTEPVSVIESFLSSTEPRDMIPFTAAFAAARCSGESPVSASEFLNASCNKDNVSHCSFVDDIVPQKGMI